MVLGIDCMSPLNRSRAEKARAAGFEFVGRYLVPPEKYAKALTAAEAHAVSGAGLGLLCVWETTADRVKNGAAAGRVDGAMAYRCARDIGMPEDGILYFAVDYAAGTVDMPTIEAYLRAARAQTVGYEVGVYGSYAVVEEMRRREACRGFWQCVAWSGGKLHPARTVYQRYWSEAAPSKAAAGKIGVSVDINECEDMKAAGIWRYREDEIMDVNRMLETMTDEQAARVVEKAQRHFAKMPLPGSWDAEGELAQAVTANITDGTNPMCMATRLEAAVMVKRAAARLAEGDDEK